MSSQVPKIPQFMLKLFLKKDSCNHRLGDFEEAYNIILEKSGKSAARKWYWKQALKSIPALTINNYLWSFSMLNNYFKVAFRNLKLNKSFSFINIFGLGTAIAICLLISTYIIHEESYDNYHANSDQIYRVSLDVQSKTNFTSYAMNVPPLAPALKKDFPEVENAGRIFLFGETKLLKRNDKLFYESGFVYADPEIFSILTFKFLEGNAKSALNRAKTVVLPKRIASKYFGNETALGKTILIDNINYTVSGVINDIPENSHMKYDAFIPIEDLRNPLWLSDWTWPGMFTYIKMKNNNDAAIFNEKINRNLAKNYLGNKQAEGNSYKFNLQPIKSIYLNSKLEYEMATTGNAENLYIYGSIGIFILFIACVNFVNLTISKSTMRAKEVGIRKVAGADKKELVKQFLTESVLISFISVICAIILFEIFRQIFNNATGFNFQPSILFEPLSIALLIFLTILLGIVAGSYPSFVLASFMPTKALQGKINKHNSAARFRKILAVAQFSLSIILLIGTIVIFKQLDFMKNKNLGFNKEQKMIIPVRDRFAFAKNYEALKNEILQSGNALSVSASGNAPGEGAGSLQTRLVGSQSENSWMMYYNFIDESFLPLYEIKLLAGKNFDSINKELNLQSCIINESAMKAFGWHEVSDALGKKVLSGLQNEEKTVIGVIKDYHYLGVQYKIDPQIIEFNPQMFQALTVKINMANLNETIKKFEASWKNVFPAIPFEYNFLDESFNDLYNSEEVTGKIVLMFTSIGLFIACIGLFGVSTFIIQQRTKEISIRKILGASFSGNLFLVMKDFLSWVALSAVIACPIAFYILADWLNAFPYHIEQGIFPYLISIALAILAALLTVFYQAVKTILINPVNVIKGE